MLMSHLLLSHNRVCTDASLSWHTWISWQKIFDYDFFLMTVQRKTGCVLFFKRAGTKEQRGLKQFRKLWLNLLESRWLSLNFSRVRSFKPVVLQTLNIDFVLDVRIFDILYFKMKLKTLISVVSTFLVKFFQRVEEKKKIQWSVLF